LKRAQVITTIYNLRNTYKLSRISYSNCVSFLMLLLNVIGNFEGRPSIIFKENTPSCCIKVKKRKIVPAIQL